MSRRHASWITGSVLLAALVAASGGAQTPKNEPPWVAKDWTTWTAEDCRAVLVSSPWVQSVSVGGDYGPVLDTSVRIVSALPIRQALLRQKQLDKNYDKMNAAKKQEFDQEHATDLSDPGEDKIIVEISNDSVWSPYASDIPGNVYIDEKAAPMAQAAIQRSDGVLVPPISTKVVKNGEYENDCQYVFPGIVDGKPIFTSSDTSFSIVMGGPLTIDKKTKQVVPEPFQYHSEEYLLKDTKTGKKLGTEEFLIPYPEFMFTISKMIYKGKLEY